VTQPLFWVELLDIFDHRISYNEAVWSAIGVVGCETLFVTIIFFTSSFDYLRMRVASCALMYKRSIYESNIC
jgi:hypothetical protein